MGLVIFLLFVLYPSVINSWYLPSLNRFQHSHSPRESKFLSGHCKTLDSIKRIKQTSFTLLKANSPDIIDAEFNEIQDPSGNKLDFTTNIRNIFTLSKTKLFNTLSSIKNSNVFTKDNVAKLGFNVLLSYGWISNTFAITGVIISWIIFGKANNISPLAPGQWKKFLLVYAGVWAANNLLRPIRVSLSILVAPLFEKFIDNLQARFKVSRSIAVAMVVFLFNIIGSFSYLFVGLYVATSIAHVPLLHKP